MSEQSSELSLDDQLVSTLVAEQFPDLATAEVSRLAAGSDHEVFAVGPKWVFRFPKRIERVAWLTRELDINATVSEVLGSKVPRVELVGTPSTGFPFPFVAYRRLPGVAADQVRTGDLGGLARDMGRLLSKLHRIDAESIPPPPTAGETDSWEQLRVNLTEVADVVRACLPADLLTKAEPYLAGRVVEPRQDGPRRFIHNDICPDHVIIDPASRRLVGLIDFTDAMVGEVVLDFVGLIGLAGYPFIEQVAACYDLPLGDSFWAKLTWLSHTLTLTWFAETAIHDPEDLPKHLSWVSRAFHN